MQNETITLENSRPSSYKFKHTLRLWPSNLTSRYLPQKMKACVHTETWIQVVWYSHLFQNFPQFLVIRTVIGFGIVNKAEIDVFLEFSCFFYDPVDVGNLISGSSAFSKTSLNIWKFTVHVLLKTGLENFKHYFTSMWDECNCAVVWAFFGIAFLWDWNENWPFPVLWQPLSFPNLLAYWVQHFHSIIF